MRKRIHIAQVIDSLGEGGAERLLLTFSEIAIQRGHTVTVISLADDAKRYPSSLLTKSLLGLGVNVISMDTYKLYDPRPFFAILRIFSRERFDIVQTHLSHGCILGGVAGWFIGIPVVATLHNPAPRRIGHYRIREFVWEFVLRRLAARVIAVGSTIQEAYKSKLPEGKIDLVLNSVSSTAVSTASERDAVRIELVGNLSSKLIFCVGRLVAGKGLSELLSAFAQIHKQYPDLYLIMVGEGALRENLVHEAESLQIMGSIRFLGMRNDVQRLLAAADIYVSASYSEGMSIALLEAMAAGLPIVATAVGEAPHLLADNRGILIPWGDVDALVLGFRYLLENPTEMIRMGRTVREYVQNNCSPDVWLDQLETVYSKAMGVPINGR